ncbi:three-helix bundle dimerization domain-containing protein [Mycolicibacterium brisbanense]
MSEIIEQEALADIRARLVQEFPEVMPADLDAAIGHAYDHFKASRVRDFIPLFVEKYVRDVLAGRHTTGA